MGQSPHGKDIPQSHTPQPKDGQSQNGQFNNKVVWITGAGTGIGRATALMFAAEGATLALMGRREEVLERVATEIAQARREGDHAPAKAVPLDVSQRGAVNRTTGQLLAQWGRVDILVNNAGLNIPGRRLHDMKPEDWDLVVGVNLTGAYNMIAAALPSMRTQGGGLVINVSSMAGKRVSGLTGAAYAASKHGMNALSETINQEEWPHGIRATALCPGEVNTEILDRRPVPVSPEDRERLIAAEDLAEAVRFVSALHPRTSIPEILLMPTHKRQHKPGETG